MSSPATVTPPVAESVPLVATVENADDDGAPPIVTDPKPAAAAAAAAAAESSDEKEQALAEVFAIARMKFLIKDVATEAANRATDLLESSPAIRILVNGHFMRERELHARLEARETASATELKERESATTPTNSKIGKKLQKELKEKKAVAAAAVAPAATSATSSAPEAAASAAAAPTSKPRVFSRPLIIHTQQKADGSWVKARILDLNPAIPTDKLTRDQLDDYDLAGVNALRTAAHYAANGFEGFALIVDALERTERQMICRHVTFARVLHKESTADIGKIKDAEKRVAALAAITRFVPFFSSLAIEDLEGKKVLLFRERARLAEASAPAGTPPDGARVATSFQPSDTREVLELKRQKQLTENDAEHVLNELRREAVSYQNYALSRSAISLLIGALRQKPAILEHIELQVKAGKKEPTLVSFICKNNSVDTSDLPISYASADQLRANLERARAEGNKPEIERNEKILAKLVADGKRPGASNLDAEGKPLPVGADCIVFEIVHQLTGIAMPINSMHLGAFPDVLAMRPNIAAANDLERRMKALLSTKAQMAGVEVKMADFDDETMSSEIEALVATIGERKKMSHDDWVHAKAKIMKAFEEAAAKADAAEDAAKSAVNGDE